MPRDKAPPSYQPLVIIAVALAVILPGFALLGLAVWMYQGRTTADAPAPSALRVDLAGTSIGKVAAGAPRYQVTRYSREEGLVITLQLTNTTANRNISLTPWCFHGKASLSDDKGNSYRPLHVFGFVSSVQVLPGAKAEEVLLFERPVPGAGMLTLSLDRRDHGEQGQHVLHFPPP
jgi:hypothetical protein